MRKLVLLTVLTAFSGPVAVAQDTARNAASAAHQRATPLLPWRTRD